MSARWQALIIYRLDTAKALERRCEIEELHELEELVELGPDWAALERVEVRLLRQTRPGLTLVEAVATGDERAETLMLGTNSVP